MKLDIPNTKTRFDPLGNRGTRGESLSALEQSIGKYSVDSDELKKLADGSWLYPDIIRKGETTLFLLSQTLGKHSFSCEWLHILLDGNSSQYM